MPAYTYCTTDLLERVIRCASFNGGHLHSECASHPDVYPAAIVPCEHAARGCNWAILRSANLRYRCPALSPHSARRFLPHLRFPHSGVEDRERAPMRQVRRHGWHACRELQAPKAQWESSDLVSSNTLIAHSPQPRVATTTTARLQLSPPTSTIVPLYPWHGHHY